MDGIKGQFIGCFQIMQSHPSFHPLNLDYHFAVVSKRFRKQMVCQNCAAMAACSAIRAIAAYALWPLLVEIMGME